MSKAAELERIVDAFIKGRTDFARFCRKVEQQLAHHPEHVVPALEHIGELKESGRISPALHALISQQLDRSSKGDITASFDEPEPPPPPPPPAPPDPAEAHPPGAPPVLVNEATGRIAGAEPAAGEASPRTPPAPAATPPAAGAVLAGRYRLDAVLDRGGMSVVYRASDLRRHGPDTEAARVGIKLANQEHAGRDYRRALEREASLLAELSHPGIVRMLGFDQDGEHAFMVMELLSGERLRSRLVRSHPEPLPADEAIRIIHKLAQALAYLHGRKLVHRDVKPANVFVTSTGGVRLVDFGLAAPVGGSGDPADIAPRGWTPLYASPEMLAGAAADPRDDVYSLGCVAYEILAGRHPWGSLPGDQAAHRKLRARRPSGLSRPRWRVLRKALEFRAAARPANAGEFIEHFFPPARPRRVVPWVAAAFLAGIISGPALRDLATDPWTGRSGSLSPEVVTPPPDMPPAETLPPESAPGESNADAPVAADEAAELPADDPVAEPLEAPAETPAADPPGPEPEPEPQSEPGSEPESVPEQEPVAADPPASVPEQEPAVPSRPAPAAISFTSDRLQIREGAGAVRLELRRPAGYPGMLGVQWRTVDGSARDGVDFIGRSSWQRAVAAPGAPSLLLFIPIVDDSVPNRDRSFLVELRQLPDGPPVASPDRLEVTIFDDD